MANYIDHSKFIYTNYDAIQDGIHSGEINKNDILWTRDTHENVLITPDMEIVPIQCRVYRFNDADSANEILNQRTDTYAGQIVAILGNRGNYSAYIVNQRINGKYAVDPLNINDANTVIDYNTLGNRPITNLIGDTFSPIVLDEQKDGIYKVSGSYKLSGAIETIFYGGNSYLFIIEHQDNGTTLIKRLGAEKITDYNITENGFTTAIVPTTKWLSEQGYVTESYVDTKIAALNFITQSEIEEYVQNVVLQTIESTVNEKIEEILNNKLTPVTEKEALDTFTKIFDK